MEKPREKPRIGIIIETSAYLPLCLPGLKYLANEQAKGKISVPWGIEIAKEYGVMNTLMSLYFADVWIIGSGAMRLASAADNFLRNVLHNGIPVIGVTFGDQDADFLEACQQAVNGPCPEINFEPVPPLHRISLDEAIEGIIAAQILAKKL